MEVYAHLRRLNPVIQGEETGQVFFRFANGATAIWDANRYNEVESPSPRYTFGETAHRCDGRAPHAGHRSEPPRQAAWRNPAATSNTRDRNVNFAGDCVYATAAALCRFACGQAREFESNGEDYLKTLAVVDAVYESARTGKVVGL